MSKIPAGTKATMPLKNVYNNRSKLTTTIAAALLTVSPQISRELHTSNLITSFIGGGKPQHALTTHVPKFQRIQHYSSSDKALPSHVKVNLPALSSTMESGTIVSWQKKEGDKLEEGDLLCEIETDKATMGFETPEEGYLAKILIAEGTKDVLIGKLLCIIVENEADVASFKTFTEDIHSEPAPPAAKGATVAQPVEGLHSVATQPKEPLDSTASATPFAKELAEKQGVDLRGVQGSGPLGKVLASDIISGGPRPQAPASSKVEGFVDLPLSSLRQSLAKRFTDTKFNIPHYYLTSEILLDNIITVQERLNTLLEKTVTDSSISKLSIEDFVIKAAALACMKVPEANSFFMGTHVRQNQNVHISIPVSTGHGLVFPVIQNAQSRGLIDIHKYRTDFAKRAMRGDLKPHELQDGTFTVSSTSLYGGEANVSAILNPPQACNLAIGKTTKKLIPNDQEVSGFESVKSLSVTLSCDHRVVDGAIGAVWLKHFKEYLEQPQSML